MTDNNRSPRWHPLSYGAGWIVVAVAGIARDSEGRVEHWLRYEDAEKAAEQLNGAPHVST